MFQKVELIGHLTRNPEMSYLPSGVAVTNFSIATNEKWSNGDGELQERVTWWRITCWRRMAETTNQYLSKGRQVFVEGRMTADPDTGGPRVYTRNNGEPGASFEVTAFTVKFLGGRNGNGAAPEESSDQVVLTEDLPF